MEARRFSKRGAALGSPMLVSWQIWITARCGGFLTIRTRVQVQAQLGCLQGDRRAHARPLCDGGLDV